MKKIIRLIIASCLIFTLLLPQVAFASVEGEQNEWEDIYLSDEEFETVLANNPQNDIMLFSTGLIERYKIGISKNGNTLIIAGSTNCVDKVIKSGFTKVTIQRRSSNTASWSNYKTYSDLYKDTKTYNLSKSISVTRGYQYRVTCTHYAKKSLLSTEKINNTSNILTF